VKSVGYFYDRASGHSTSSLSKTDAYDLVVSPTGNDAFDSRVRSPEAPELPVSRPRVAVYHRRCLGRRSPRATSPEQFGLGFAGQFLADPPFGFGGVALAVAEQTALEFAALMTPPSPTKPSFAPNTKLQAL